MRGIATLRFTAGAMPGAMGPEEVGAGRHPRPRQQCGRRHRAASGGPEAGCLDLAGRPRCGRPASTAPPTSSSCGRASPGPPTPRRYTSSDGGVWSPWGQLDTSAQDARRERRRSKPKSIFQLLFN
ncbi:MAG: hypothetical protein WDN31_04555 [Hyphomicrobium sp.]